MVLMALHDLCGLDSLDDESIVVMYIVSSEWEVTKDVLGQFVPMYYEPVQTDPMRLLDHCRILSA